MRIDLGADHGELLHLEHVKTQVVVVLCLVHVIVRQATRPGVLPRWMDSLRPDCLVHLLVPPLFGALLDGGHLSVVVAEHSAHRRGGSHRLAKALMALPHNVDVADLTLPIELGPGLGDPHVVVLPETVLALNHTIAADRLREQWWRACPGHSC